MVAGSARPAAIAPNQPTRNPASNASPAPVVSAAVSGWRRHLEAEALGPVPGHHRGPLRPSLHDRARRELEQALDAVPAEQRLRLGRGREQEVRRRLADELPRDPPATTQERADRRQVEADERATRPARARSRDGRPRRAAGRAASRPERGGRRSRRTRPGRDPRDGAGRRRHGRPRTTAPRRARPRHRSARVRTPATRTARTRTLSARTASTSARPAASRPTAVTSVAFAPSRPSQRAVVAADPPCTNDTEPGHVGAALERALGPQDDVEHQVADHDDPRGGR